MSILKVDTITKADGTGSLSVPAESGTVVTTASPSLGRRNLIINGAMQVAQRGTSFSSISSSQFTLDRWQSQIVTTSSRMSVTQESAGGPPGFNNFLRAEVATADASLGSTDLQCIKQHIEGYNISHTNQGTSDAKTLTCSFWTRSSVVGTYAVALYLNSSGTTYAYPAEYTINAANTWEYKTVTFEPQTTSASWVSSGYTNGEYAQLRFGLMAGSSFSGTANSWNATNAFGSSGQDNLFATSGATWDLTGVQLEVGSVATPFEHRSYGEELTLCQRYYWKWKNDSAYQFIDVGYVFSTTQANVPITYPVKMRASPTTSTSGNFRVCGGSCVTVTSMSGNNVGTQGGSLEITTGGGLTAGQVVGLGDNNDISAYLAWDAEL